MALKPVYHGKIKEGHRPEEIFMNSPDLDMLKAKIARLSFKKSTEGLTPEEEKELQALKKALALKQMSS